LVYELPDGKLKLIDGQLRRDMDPDIEVEVEMLDVNDEEARALSRFVVPLVPRPFFLHFLEREHAKIV
jgi:hypothetical protein